jgi:hypothetical protein
MRPVRSMTRFTAGVSWGASAGLPCSTLWSTITLVHDHAVVALDELRLVTELHRLAEAALGDRPGVRVVQADPSCGSVRNLPAQPLPSPRSDVPGRSHQIGQVVDRTCQPPPAAPRGRVVFTARRQRRGLRARPTQRPVGVRQQTLGLVRRGLGQVGQLTGRPPDRRQRLVPASGAAAAKLGGDGMRALASRAGPVADLGPGRPASGRIRLCVAAIRPIALASSPESVG